MVCHHLEILAMDIQNQGIRKIQLEQDAMNEILECTYVDCYLDGKSIRQQLQFPDFIKDHVLEETDGFPKEGFICEQCNQLIIGKHKDSSPGCRTFGYNAAGEPQLIPYPEDSEIEDISLEPEKPLKPKSRLPGLPTITFVILLGLPIALHQYLPNHMMLGFITGICMLMITPIILSPVTQFLRGRSNYTFPFFGIFIVLLLGVPLFVIYGWDAIVYVLAVYAGIAFFGGILLRVLRKKK